MKFHKYHGTGNDFILIDGMSSKDKLDFNTEFIAKMCHRRFGIGADGFIILSPSESADFKMDYFNSDGKRSTMCGNGSRCLVRFAHTLGYISDETKFEAVDGLHEAKVAEDISVKMIDVKVVEPIDEDYFLDTGSPHYVQFGENLDDLDIIKHAHAIRYNNRFRANGTNVNFVKRISNGIQVRTYERGVEDETYSCGTGVVASAIAGYQKFGDLGKEIAIDTKGGALKVSFATDGTQFTSVWLHGPAEKVFSGQFPR